MFKQVTMEDRDWVSECLRKANQRGSEYTFSNLYNWSAAYTVQLARFQDFALLRSGTTAMSYM